MKKKAKKSVKNDCVCYHIFCEIYDANIILYYGDHKNCLKTVSDFLYKKNKNVHKKIIKDFEKYLNSDDCTSEYFCSDNWPDEQWIIICIKKTKNINDLYELGCLSHECTHAAIFILQTRGIKDANGGYEALAYLQEYIFKKCLKLLRYKRKSKNEN